MTSTTTVQLGDATKEELEGLKQGNKETYDEVVWRLIEHYNDNAESGEVSDDRVRELAREVAREEITEHVVAEAQR